MVDLAEPDQTMTSGSSYERRLFSKTSRLEPLDGAAEYMVCEYSQYQYVLVRVRTMKLRRASLIRCATSVFERWDTQVEADGLEAASGAV